MRSIEKPSSRARLMNLSVYTSLRVDAIAAGAAVRGRDQVGRFVIADGLGGHP